MVHLNIIRFESFILERPIRSCGIFTESGEKIFEKQENASWKFQFSDKESQIMEHKIFTLNDARGDLPSLLFLKDDIKLATERKFKELRLVTRSGTYSLMPTLGNWPSFETICKTFKESRIFLDRLLFEEAFKKAVTDEGLDYQDDHFWYIQYYIWKKAAMKLNLNFQRTI